MSSTDYEFDWDDNKAAINLNKHGVDFREAMTVMLDPLAMTFFDTEHSEDEDRWVSVGRGTIVGGAYVCGHWPQYGPGAHDLCPPSYPP